MMIKKRLQRFLGIKKERLNYVGGYLIDSYLISFSDFSSASSCKIAPIASYISSASSNSSAPLSRTSENEDLSILQILKSGKWTINVIQIQIPSTYFCSSPFIDGNSFFKISVHAVIFITGLIIYAILTRKILNHDKIMMTLSVG